eukprot:3534596-Amphidinium_carterae.1
MYSTKCPTATRLGRPHHGPGSRVVCLWSLHLSPFLYPGMPGTEHACSRLFEGICSCLSLFLCPCPCVGSDVVDRIALWQHGDV